MSIDELTDELFRLKFQSKPAHIANPIYEPINHEYLHMHNQDNSRGVFIVLDRATKTFAAALLAKSQAVKQLPGHGNGNCVSCKTHSGLFAACSPTPSSHRVTSCVFVVVDCCTTVAAVGALMQ